jgi:hypothetical protein
MIADDLRRRRELEAVAFGRVDTTEDEAAAARALMALRELDDRAASVATEPVDDEPVDAGPVNDGPVDAEAIGYRDGMGHGALGGVPRRVTESLRRFWVIPVVIASIALGAIGGSWMTRTAAHSPAGPAASSDTTVVANSAAPQPPSDADGSSAEDWLDQPQRSSDIFPDPQALAAYEVDPNSTHVVRMEGTTHFWIARGNAGSLCLVMMATSDGSLQVRCVPPELFPGIGVSAEANDGTSAHWGPDGVTFVDPIPKKAG